MRQWRGPAAAAAALALAGAHPAQGGGRGPATPSGLPVPRYISTKFALVNARSGPGDDYRLQWSFHARGLPLQVIAETEDWRRVCDPEGGVSWVHRRTVAETRTVLRVSANPLPLLRAPRDDARVTAMLAGRATAALKTCAKGWCQVSADHVTGWVRQGEVWGTADAPQCP